MSVRDDTIALLARTRTQIEVLTAEQRIMIPGFRGVILDVDRRVHDGLFVELRDMDMPHLEVTEPVETAEEANAIQAAYEAAMAMFLQRSAEARQQAPEKWRAAIEAAEPGDAPTFAFGEPHDDAALHAWDAVARRLLALQAL